mgnify:CR=1 FL=1
MARSSYLTLSELSAALDALAHRHPEWVQVDSIGLSAQGRPIWLVSLGHVDADRDRRPAFWLDGGTHCAEWAGVMGALDALERWASRAAQDARFADWLGRHTIYVVPCISPDGYAAMLDGAPYIRSTLRPPPEGSVRTGWSPEDMDGDGVVRLMRWRHPAGAFVIDETHPLHMRFRTPDDDPDDAFFVAEEGRFVAWDGVRWTGATREFGLDLNRNFPGGWRPFSMFGMDAGAFPGSAPESRAVIDALHARPNVSAAVSLHTFTGALLTPPYRADTPLGRDDVALMRSLGRDCVQDTDYAAIAVHPDFTYDAANPIGGVWADTLATVFGVAGYTLEIWDPFAAAGVTTRSVAQFFRDPEPEVLQGLVAWFSDQPGTRAWTPLEHPQLGAVEVGGIEMQRTVRNPPDAMLARELDTVFAIVERARRVLPEVRCTVSVEARGTAAADLLIVVENMGYLGTSGLEQAARIGRVPGVRVTVSEGESVLATHDLGQLDGWGQTRSGSGAMPLLPALPARGHRAHVRVPVTGDGPWTVSWHTTRAGRGSLEVAR